MSDAAPQVSPDARFIFVCVDTREGTVRRWTYHYVASHKSVTREPRLLDTAYFEPTQMLPAAMVEEYRANGTVQG